MGMPTCEFHNIQLSGQPEQGRETPVEAQQEIHSSIHKTTLLCSTTWQG
jgi:hypothetical protein